GGCLPASACGWPGRWRRTPAARWGWGTAGEPPPARSRRGREAAYARPPSLALRLGHVAPSPPRRAPGSPRPRRPRQDRPGGPPAMRFLPRLLISATALWVAVQLVPGITYQGGVLPLLAVALVFGVLNAFVRPLLTLLSLPFLIITLGLFTFVLNAVMLM